MQHRDQQQTASRSSKTIRNVLGKLCPLGLFAVLLLGPAIASYGSHIRFATGDFTPSQWSTTTVAVTAEGEVEAFGSGETVSTGGNPGAYRSTGYSAIISPEAQGTFVATAQYWEIAKYNPIVQGPIENVVVSFQARAPFPIEFASFGLAMRQDVVQGIPLNTIPLHQPSSSNWTSGEAIFTGAIENYFEFHGQPDFSSFGGHEITFGFYIGGSLPSFATGAAVDFDNVVIEINAPGLTQSDPILPTSTDSGHFEFLDAPSGRWFDPPAAHGFRYEMISGSLFTGIDGFPTGFMDPFTVSVGGVSLGMFAPGQTVDFGTGVSSFDITGINPLVDPSDPTAFPLQLTFDTPTADFRMTPLLAQAVPEPSSLLLAGLAVPSLLVVAMRQARNRCAKTP